MYHNYIQSKNLKYGLFFKLKLLIEKLKMQRPMPVSTPSLMTNSFKDAAKVDAVGYTPEFESLYSWMENFYKWYDKGEMAYSMIRYLPGLAKIAYQGQLAGTEAKRKYADDTYKEKKLLNFMFCLQKNTT